MKFPHFSIGMIVTVVLVACAAHVPFLLVSEEEEEKLGEEAYTQVLKKEKISRDAYLNRVVTQVGRRIESAAHKPEYQWEFRVLESREQNAFCLPGGKVAVYTGILPVAKNEGGLATVLGHEVAHATHRHAAQRITDSALTQLGMVGLNAVIGGKDTWQKQLLMGALGVGVTVGHSLPFSRSQEAEADKVGLHYMAQAGYDPAEAPRFWRRFMAENRGGKPPTFLSDHPSDESRISALEAELPSALLEYQQAKVHYGVGSELRVSARAPQLAE